MGDSPQESDKHSPRRDDEMQRDPSDVELSTDPDTWDSPGHDGVVGPDETDPDRLDLRSQMGQYVSLAKFPAKVADLIAVAEKRDTSEDLIAPLRRLDPDAKYPNTTALWEALDLGSDGRF